MRQYLPVFIILLLLAAVFRQSSVLTVLYFLAGVFLAASAWNRNAVSKITLQRDYPTRAFIDQPFSVQITIRNRGWLPLVWLRLHESLPVGMATPNFIERVISLPPHGKAALDYTLIPRRRGYYILGPLSASSGDLLGATAENVRKFPDQPFIVYPRIVTLPMRRIISRLPFGSLRETQPLFEDPTRPRGKREYSSGDSIRLIDWKASAATAHLQVQQYEPSISASVAVFLNLNVDDYPGRRVHDLIELAVSTAASLLAWGAANKHTLGLLTNGRDLLAESGSGLHLLPRKGASQLTLALDTLARIQTHQADFLNLVREQSIRLPWGTTMVVITGCVDNRLLTDLLSARRRGLSVLLLPVGPVHDLAAWKQKAAMIGCSVRPVNSYFDLESWV